MRNKAMLTSAHFLLLRILFIFLDSDIVETSSFQIQKVAQTFSSGIRLFSFVVYDMN